MLFERSVQIRFRPTRHDLAHLLLPVPLVDVSAIGQQADHGHLIVFLQTEELLVFDLDLFVESEEERGPHVDCSHPLENFFGFLR